MEGNKDEALRCIEIAMSKIADGNKEGAIKFLNKSISLYPTRKAKELLDFYSSQDNTANNNNENNVSSGNDENHVHKRHTATSNTNNTSNNHQSSSSTTSTSTTENKPKFTKEQVEQIKRIKKCTSYYEVLEIKKTATEIDIKKAYRKLALQMHPDKNHAPGAEEAFKTVTQAFSCLSDPGKRSAYDVHGSETPVSTRSGFGGGRGGLYEEELSPDDIFNIFFGIPPRGGGARRNHPFYSDFNQPVGRQGRTYHYQFGGNRAAHGGQQQGETSFFTIIMILFTLLYVLMSFFGGGSSGSASGGKPLASLYNFEQKFQYPVERFMRLGDEKIQVEFKYFVKDNIEGILRYNGISNQQLEDEVKESWLELQAKLCGRKELLESKGYTYSNEYKNLLSKNAFKYCDDLKSLGLRWQ